MGMMNNPTFGPWSSRLFLISVLIMSPATNFPYVMNNISLFKENLYLFSGNSNGTIQDVNSKSSLPDDEAAICARIREVRSMVKWSMPDFAAALGITRDRLAIAMNMHAPQSDTAWLKLCAERLI